MAEIIKLITEQMNDKKLLRAIRQAFIGHGKFGATSLNYYAWPIIASCKDHRSAERGKDILQKA